GNGAKACLTNRSGLIFQEIGRCAVADTRLRPGLHRASDLYDNTPKTFGNFLRFLNLPLSFLVHYGDRPLLDIEWLLSTLFDASLLSPWAAGDGGSFFVEPLPQPPSGTETMPRACVHRPLDLRARPGDAGFGVRRIHVREAFE